MCAPDPPEIPDPGDIAKQQGASDIRTAIANAILGNADIRTPFGSIDWTKTPNQTFTYEGKTYSIPTFRGTQTLSAGQQGLYDAHTAAQTNLANVSASQAQRLGSILARPAYNAGTLPSGVRNAAIAPTLTPASAAAINPTLREQIGADDFSADRLRVEEAILDRLNPQIERDRAALQSRLANQGLTQGSQAYNQGIDELNRQVNDQRMQAILAGGQEQSRLFGLDQAKGQFFNQARQQGADNALRATQHLNDMRGQQFNYNLQEQQQQQTLREKGLQEDVTLRNQPINEITQLLHGSAPTIPQFQPFNAPTIANTPVGQYAYQSAGLANNQYQQQLQQQNAMMGGLFGLGQAGIFGMFSDRRLKYDIKRVGTADNGLAIYSYKFDPYGPTHIGFMADEVEKVHPEAVMTIGPLGIKIVNYELASAPVG